LKLPMMMPQRLIASAGAEIDARDGSMTFTPHVRPEKAASSPFD
jgi:hypothetical protein